MLSAFGTGLRVLLGLIGLGNWATRMVDWYRAEHAGRVKSERDALRGQNEALRQAQDKLHDQLEKAVDRRPGDARRRLRDGTF